MFTFDSSLTDYNSGQIEISDGDLGDTIMCLNECEGIFISITQE